MDNSRVVTNYPIVVWLVTIFSGPMGWILYRGITNGGGWSSLIETLPVFFIVGILYSIPTLGVFYFVYHITRKRFKETIVKIILIITVLIGIIVSLSLIGGSIINELMVSYSLCALIATTIFKLKVHNNK